MHHRKIRQSPSQRQYSQHKSNSWWRALVIWACILLVLLRYIFGWNKSTQSSIQENEQEAQQDNTQEDGQRYYIGEPIMTAGTMTPTETFSRYSHTFVSESGETFGLKSRDIVLYEYEWKVQIKWSIDEFARDIPIILVNEIIGDRGEWNTLDLQLENTQANKHFYAYPDESIWFDLSISPDYTIIKEDNDDKLYLKDTTKDSKDNVLMSITPFVCTPWDNLKDCWLLKQRLAESNAQSITNSNNVTFLKLSESKTRLVFNDEVQYGYYFSPEDDTIINSFSSTVSFLNKTRLKNAIIDRIEKVCKNLDYTLTENLINSIDYTFNFDGTVTARINGIASDGMELICSVTIRLGNSLQVFEKVFTTWEQREIPKIVPNDTDKEMNPNQQIEEENTAEDELDTKEEKSVETTPSRDENQEDITPTTADSEEIAIASETFATLPENWSWAWWFHYNSIRWYDVYFSNKSITYAWEILETPREIAGLMCVYRINVIHYKDADNVEIAPDIEIYECTWSTRTQDSTLKTVGTSWWKVFIAKYNTQKLNNVSIVIE